MGRSPRVGPGCRCLRRPVDLDDPARRDRCVDDLDDPARHDCHRGSGADIDHGGRNHHHDNVHHDNVHHDNVHHDNVHHDNVHHAAPA
ncbi:MAG: hypothetical protein OSB37_11350 [Acidimicrobiales bacterium]|nr:hypothetical protein [Acidimicrobiales bacterium]